MTNILFLTRRFAPHIGGVETHISYLSKELHKRDVSISLITEQDSTEEPLREIINKIEVYRIALPDQSTSKVSIWKWIFQNISLFYSADIIHIHDVFFWVLPIYPLLKLHRKKIFMTFHGYEGSQNPKFNQIFWHRVANFLSDGNICIGGFHQKWYHVKPTIVSFGAVSTELSKKKIERLKNKITKIIYLGRLAEDTGIMEYLKAINIFPKKKDISLDVYGDGPQFHEAKKFVAENRLPVKFFGSVPQSSIKLNKYDIAFVSRYLSILESFITGLPVIAHYNAEIKKDYLRMSPFKKWIKIVSSDEEIFNAYKEIKNEKNSNNVEVAQKWATKQTWPELSKHYLELWSLI